MIERKAKAVWSGGLKDGEGRVSASSGIFAETPYTFATRFEQKPGTNPEELIAAAHASCFSMALSAELGKFQVRPDRIETSAVVTLEKQGEGFGITSSALETHVVAPGLSEESFRTATESAKANCPISKLLNTQITLKANLKAN